MKTAVFLRHSLAENKKTGQSDFDRKITQEGVSLAKDMAIKLKKEIGHFDLAIISPALRTRQTAEVFLEEINAERIEFFDNLYYGMGLGDFEKLFYELDDEISSVLIVGHNPFITQISMYFTDKYDLFLHPASFVIVKFDIDSWINVAKTKVKGYKIYDSVPFMYE